MDYETDFIKESNSLFRRNELMPIEKLKEIVEVLIFASDTPLSVKQIIDVVEHTKPKEIESAVETLNREYRDSGRPFYVVQVAGGYQMVSRESYSQWIRKLFHRKIKTRLSQAALETLSVIAFKQPVPKPEIEAIRGVNCEGVLHTLLERKLINLAGRGEGPGRPLLYKTTAEFLRYFGINDISDLPKPREIEEILREEKTSDKPEDDRSGQERADARGDHQQVKGGNTGPTGNTVEAEALPVDPSATEQNAAE
jgi:segregation and condensation protein B